MNDKLLLEKAYLKVLLESNIRIEKVNPEDIDACLNVFKQAFPQVDFEEAYEFLKRSVTWQDSLKAVLDDNIVGIYLLSHRPLMDTIADESATPTEDLTQYENKKGVEGIALAVLPEYQKTGIGKKLKNVVESMPVDYVYGLQYKSLGNLEHWIKSRRVVAQSEGEDAVYVTLKDLR